MNEMSNILESFSLTFYKITNHFTQLFIKQKVEHQQTPAPDYITQGLFTITHMLQCFEGHPIAARESQLAHCSYSR